MPQFAPDIRAAGRLIFSSIALCICEYQLVTFGALMYAFQARPHDFSGRCFTVWRRLQIFRT
jgi:hypothetical protein